MIGNFAPRIVSNSIWNNEALMEQYCGTSKYNFQEHVLTISNEAFLLFVLVNYTACCWIGE
jgi:hypothetical protein